MMPIDPDVQAELDAIQAKITQHTNRLNNQKAAADALHEDVAALELAMADSAALTQERFAHARERVDAIKKHIRILHPPSIAEPRRPKRSTITRSPNALSRKKK